MTNWYEQTKAMMDMWTTAQQQMMQSWMGNTTTSTEMGRMMDTWRDMMRHNIRLWTQNSDPAIQSVAEQMFGSQTAMMRLLEMTSRVWQNMAPLLQQNGDWNAGLDQQLADIRNAMLGNAADWTRASGNITQLWQTYMEQWQGYLMPWMHANQNSMSQMNAAMAGDRDALVQMTSLYWDAFQDSFGQLLQAPGVGYNREFDEKLRRSFAAWLDYQEAAYAYQVILADTWVKAFDQLIREMMTSAEQGQKVESLREFLTRWSETADRIFKDVFRTDAYVTVQSKLINALMHYRVKQREVNERFLELNDLPTRTEVDEAHRRIYELRKEVKALKRELSALKSDAAAKPARTTNAKRTTTKKKDETSLEEG